ncbi:hypothetical protein [Agromyces sp. Marseille-P2726]|uniref:hypothetical protein n=1 Tax=Agromyces sp. Marseille-P2726 TaxID=2709132 RepID=UPI00156E1D1D|nr:hypothetical protein [Agromyces sp. Marseille-P2726]
MDTALSMSTTAPAAEVGGHAAHGVAGLAHRVGMRLVAWGRADEQRHGREHLAYLHERRLEAERPRNERFTSGALTRLG